MELKTVRLLGELGRRFGRVYQLAVSTPAEAVRALVAQLEGFAEHLYHAHESGVAYRLVVGRDPEGLDLEGLHLHLGQEDCIIIAPIISGAGAFGRILLGVALLTASFFMPATIGILGLTLSSTTIGLLGAALILGGIAQLLTPTPKTPKKTDSYLIDRGAETVIQGLPVPVGYGTWTLTDLLVLSSGVDTTELKI